MKKIIIIAVLTVLFLSSCTVQQEVNPDLFMSRLSESYPELSVESENAFYEEGKCVVFVNLLRLRCVAEMTLDGNERVQKISIACAETDNADEFISFAERITAVYAPDEDFSSVSEILFGSERYSYHETQWYYYTFSQNETGFFFSIENKKLAPQKEIELTLKENDIVTVQR